jgi:hypothetical protein
MTTDEQVHETLTERFLTAWNDRTPVAIADEPLDPPHGRWVRFSILSAPSQQESLGSPGNRRFARAGRVFMQVHQLAGQGGDGPLVALAGAARDVFEGCRFQPNDIRFAAVDIGEAVNMDGGRWRGIAVQGRYEYEDLK